MAQAAQNNQQTRPVRPHIANFNRLMAKENARKLIEQRKSPFEVNQEREIEEKKIKKMEESINRIIENPEWTDTEKKAIAAGAARAWYADLLGAPADLAGMALDYGAEGFKSIMPSKELTGYDLAKELGVDKFQQAMRDPVGGYKQLEKMGEQIGYIPPTTGTDLEFYSRLAAGFADPVPLPLTAGVFASNRAKTLPKLSKAKAEKLETARNNPQEIFNQTGFFRGPEGEWRFEISDVDMKIKPEFLKSKTELWEYKGLGGDEDAVTYAKLSDVVEHPELFKAYPELEDVYIKFEPDAAGYKGYYSEKGEKVPVAHGSPLGKTREKHEGNFPEEHRKIISVVAPTRQSEIARLDRIIVEERSKLVAAETRIDAIQKNVAEGRATQDETYLHKFGDEYKEVNLNTVKDELTNTIERSQETIKEHLPELQRLQEGGKVDIEFSVKSTIAHEIQHAIQDIENLPAGGSTYSAREKTQRAAIEPLLEEAREKFPDLMERQGVIGFRTEKQAYSEKLRDMSFMDDVRYLQQLQKFILSDQPTRNARFIENSSYSYRISNDYDMRDWLGPRPKKHKKKEYAEYLRKKALLYQHIVINKYVPNKPLKQPENMVQHVTRSRTDRFNILLGDLIEYTEKKGTSTHPKEMRDQFRYQMEHGYTFGPTAETTAFDPMKIFNKYDGSVGQTLYPEGRTGWNVGDYDQPNWLALGEKNVANYIKRLARKADQHADAAGMETKIQHKYDAMDAKEREWANLGKDSDYEYYKRLAGEAEARAVQKRLEFADIEAGGYGPYNPDLMDPKFMDYELSKLQEGKGKVPTEIYDVPKSELAFVRDRKGLPFSRSQAAKTQAKSDAQAILNQ